MKTPTFVCGTCKKEFKASKIDGVWYAVNGMHFLANEKRT